MRLLRFTIPVKIQAKSRCRSSSIVHKRRKIFLPRPLKELKGFEKIYLNPGEQKEVTITIDKSALSFFDPVKHDWVAEPGDFEALIGNSSDAIKTKIKFSLQ